LSRLGRGLRRREKNATEAGAGRFEKPAPYARAAPPEAQQSFISRKTVAEVPLTGLDFYPLHDTNADGRILLKPGPPVDASATLPDGTAIHHAVDLKRYVAEHVDRFASCLAAKLFLYGTGRTPTYAERKQIDAAVASVLARGGGCRDLILAVIDTESVRTR